MPYNYPTVTIDAEIMATPSWTAKMRYLILRFAAAAGIGKENIRREESFRIVMAQYDDMISRICLGYARSRQEFEDLRQDCYINIWQSLDKFQGRSQLKTWLYRIVLNTNVATIRRRSKEPQKIALTELQDIIDDDSEHIRLVAEMHEMIALLPPLDKAIILLWLDETSYDDIAEIVGLPRNTVATRLRRAKEKLTNKL